MTKAQLFWDSSVQAYRLKMHGDWAKTEKIVEFLKKQIPHSDRNLDTKINCSSCGTELRPSDNYCSKCNAYKADRGIKKDYTWTFTEEYFDGTVKFLHLVFGSGEVAVITRQQVEAAQQPRLPLSGAASNPQAQACYEFMKAIPFEAAQKAYREAAIRLHPDRGGNMEQMSTVNALWTRIQKEIYGQ